MAASLAAAALDADLSVGLFAWSNGWLGIPPLRGKIQRSDILSALARLPTNSSYGAQEVLDRCHTLLKSGTTPVLFTPEDIEVGLSEEVRGQMIAVSALSASADVWFKFEPDVNFETCMPLKGN
jgi:uncharacterized protein (DUF58 family)